MTMGATLTFVYTPRFGQGWPVDTASDLSADVVQQDTLHLEMNEAIRC